MSQNYDLDLERAMAALSVFDFAAFNAQGVSYEDFSSGECRLIAQAAADAWELDDAGLEGVVRALQRSGKLAAVGGRAGLQSTLASSGAPDAARLRHLAALRRLENLAVDTLRVLNAGDLAGALERLQTALSIGTDSGAVEVKDGGQLVHNLLQRLGHREGPGVEAVYPGLECLRDAIGNLPIGSCTVVGADTGVGKSSITLEMGIGFASSGGTFGLVGVEDPEEVTGSRLLGALAGIDSRALQAASINPSQAARLPHGIERVGEIGPRMLFADCTGGTDIDVRAAMSQMAARGAKLIAVDYITEVESSKKQQDRRNEVRWVARQLKSHAKKLGVALVLVSQIARPEGRNANIKPTKHHLKESGDVTNAAEVILLLWREQEDDSAPVKGYVAKCKWGGLGRWWQMRRTESGRLVEDNGL